MLRIRCYDYLSKYFRLMLICLDKSAFYYVLQLNGDINRGM